jgi:hypothetical protein
MYHSQRGPGVYPVNVPAQWPGHTAWLLFHTLWRTIVWFTDPFSGLLFFYSFFTLLSGIVLFQYLCASNWNHSFKDTLLLEQIEVSSPQGLKF